MCACIFPVLVDVPLPSERWGAMSTDSFYNRKALTREGSVKGKRKRADTRRERGEAIAGYNEGKVKLAAAAEDVLTQGGSPAPANTAHGKRGRGSGGRGPGCPQQDRRRLGSEGTSQSPKQRVTLGPLRQEWGPGDNQEQRGCGGGLCHIRAKVNPAARTVPAVRDDAALRGSRDRPSFFQLFQKRTCFKLLSF